MIQGDLVSADFCREAVERTVKELGGIDILVSNAAWQNRKPDVTSLSDEELDRTMKINVYAYLRLAREAIPHMQPGAAIIASGSVVGLQGSGRLPDYGATKEDSSLASCECKRRSFARRHWQARWLLR